MPVRFRVGENFEIISKSYLSLFRTSLDYQGVGRKLLVVDPLPQGALPVYDKDVDAKAFVLSRRGRVPDQIIEGDRIQVPTWGATRSNKKLVLL